MLLLCNFLPSSIFLCNVSIQFNESLYMKPRLQVFLPFLCFKSVNGNVSGELNKRKITCIISLVQGILLAYCFTTSYFIYIEPCHKCTIKMTNQVTCWSESRVKDKCTNATPFLKNFFFKRNKLHLISLKSRNIKNIEHYQSYPSLVTT